MRLLPASEADAVAAQVALNQQSGVKFQDSHQNKRQKIISESIFGAAATPAQLPPIGPRSGAGGRAGSGSSRAPGSSKQPPQQPKSSSRSRLAALAGAAAGGGSRSAALQKQQLQQRVLLAKRRKQG